jgi:hypothetical protein
VVEVLRKDASEMRDPCTQYQDQCGNVPCLYASTAVVISREDKIAKLFIRKSRTDELWKVILSIR